MRRVVLAPRQIPGYRPGLRAPNGRHRADAAGALPRSLCAPSLLAHIIMQKYGQGMPLFRIEDAFARDETLPRRPRHDVPVGRGRWSDLAGRRSVPRRAPGRPLRLLHRHRRHRRRRAAHSSPMRRSRKPLQARALLRAHRRPRSRLLRIATQENSDAVRTMFSGVLGCYVQADAKKRLRRDLFREPGRRRHQRPRRRRPAPRSRLLRPLPKKRCRKPPSPRACVGREGASPSSAVSSASARLPGVTNLPGSNQTPARRPSATAPSTRSSRARPRSRPDKVRDQRNILRSALGYAVRRKDALLRVLRRRTPRARQQPVRNEPCVPSPSGERPGSSSAATTTPESAGHLFSLIASCKLHRLDPEAYLLTCCAFSPTGPRTATSSSHLNFLGRHPRSRLDPSELANEIGPLAVPPPAQR